MSFHGLDMVKKAVDTNKSSREELFRAFQVFGKWEVFQRDRKDRGKIFRSRSKWIYYYGRASNGLNLIHLEDIDWSLFVIVLESTGDHPTDEDALEMIAEADIDGDGRSNEKSRSYHLSALLLLSVNYDEFVLTITNNTSSRKWWIIYKISIEFRWEEK